MSRPTGSNVCRPYVLTIPSTAATTIVRELLESEVSARVAALGFVHPRNRRERRALVAWERAR